MRTIIDKLRDSLANIKDQSGNALQFVYEDADIRNIEFERIPAPLVTSVPLASSVVVGEHNIYREQITIAVWFADAMMQGSGDYCATDNERVIDGCKQMAFKWLSSLSPASELRLVSVNGAERAYLEGDANLTGYMLNVTLEETDGRCNG